MMISDGDMRLGKGRHSGSRSIVINRSKDTLFSENRSHGYEYSLGTVINV